MCQTEVVEKVKTHFLRSETYLFKNRAVCEIMWTNIVQPNRLQITVWCMRIACWIPKATNTLSEYVVLYVFALQQWSGVAPQCYVIRTLPDLFLITFRAFRVRETFICRKHISGCTSPTERNSLQIFLLDSDPLNHSYAI